MLTEQKEELKCKCGEVMNTEHDDRKFEVDCKQVCIFCWIKSLEFKTSGVI